MKENGQSETHPAYGILMFSRINGGNPNLFGSSVKNYSRIRMTLCHGTMERHSGRDRYSAEEEICVAEMSLTQFSEAVTSMNIYPGVPVTVTYTEKDGTTPPLEDIPDRREQFLSEFRKKNGAAARAVHGLVEEVRDMLGKKTLTKKDRERILDGLIQIENAVGPNSDFAAEQFNEAVDGIIKEAKGEVEAFIQDRMNGLALTAMAREHGQIASGPAGGPPEKEKHDKEGIAFNEAWLSGDTAAR